ncbi:hypothetical protein GCM10008983_14700 [Lentibacillus halophilus]|uniref:DUF4367 domain-containing protein n=1 Tax=Lentibacillus halophilus TaxID=295065 RepID=A0ABN0Z9F1_9BACI
MKKAIYIVMMFIFILVGCSDESGSKDLIEYNKEKVISSLSKLEFNPKIPHLLSFEPTETNVEVKELGRLETNYLTVTFVNDNQEEITFRAGTTENAIDFTEEKVNITDNLVGRYGKKDKIKILKWDEDNSYYDLLVDSDSTSKKEILKIAKSFYRIN